jgi:mRNA interferase MazF
MPKHYNASRGMMICCPMTSKIKSYVFEVIVSTSPPSAVLSDQLKNLDWRARDVVYIGKVLQKVLLEVQAKVKALLDV